MYKHAMIISEELKRAMVLDCKHVILGSGIYYIPST